MMDKKYRSFRIDVVDHLTELYPATNRLTYFERCKVFWKGFGEHMPSIFRSISCSLCCRTRLCVWIRRYIFFWHF